MGSSCKIKSRPGNVREFFTTWYFWKPFLGIMAGVLAGYIYFHYVESSTNSWQITSEAYSSIAFGGFLGFFVTSSPCSCFGRRC
jgi:hypothetical protein